MVSRSTIDALLDVLRIAFGCGMNDEELKAQAIQDPEQTKRLIAIETSRARDKRKHTALLGVLGLAALVIIMAKAAPFIMKKARALELPWSDIRTTLGSVVMAAAIAGLSWWVKRKLAARGSATPQNPPESRNEGDQNQVGTG
ncbi:hypothetical protein SAM23877_5719 [Streptomyces ambofaciens ATCC 23877]|uniref:Uncharacterized protein n=1 Tax=Streptomyces ambofaciens (strain ATCC 23877 / 3486 / DSM 40053 / JCM 4204 / NBRC 12836 / NRRL B-2516) TaxID=278992 RepID=A0A0K2B0F9_STRA7|nr:hypothetical protein [Streptomyces ambofaciens]AKZ58764.1 hypothetical protein SAM23877_5719 [Streptomyces ambofaciens ATCC 23877]